MLCSVSEGRLSDARKKIAVQHRRNEEACVAELVALTELDAGTRQRIEASTLALIATIRRPSYWQRPDPLAAILEQFPLSSAEGLQLMGLAEALLRVPDAATAQRLIADKLGTADWRSHLREAEPLWMKGLIVALILNRKLLTAAPSEGSTPGDRQVFGKVLRDLQRRAMCQGTRWLGSHFVFASSIDAALVKAEKFAARGYQLSYDMLGEGARCEGDARRHYLHYEQMMKALATAESGNGKGLESGLDVLRGNVSIKLSALHPRYEPAQRQRVMAELVPRVLKLAQEAKSSGLSLTIDAEESWRLSLSLDVFAAVYCHPALAGWNGFGLALQAYQKRALAVLEWLRELAATQGRSIPLRLVKGAYWDSEIKLAQQGGYEAYPVFTRKASTDLNYQACAHFLLRQRRYFYPQFATHNPYTVATVLELERQVSAADPGHFRAYEFQRLHGMGEALFEAIHQQGQVCRVYAPVGEQAELLSYLVRRILENGANSSVLGQLQNNSIEARALVQNPGEQVKAWPQAGHPQIPLPAALYPGVGGQAGRINSLGCDLDDESSLQSLLRGVAAHGPVPLDEDGLVNRALGESTVEIRNPARPREVLARIALDGPEQLHAKLKTADLAAADWAATRPAQRCQLLRRLADELQNNRDRLVGLCIAESGKTLADSVGEVREAVDFCRYYAERAEILFDDSGVLPRGVVLCISPWNFPLAIFIGQIAAALACGNTVVAKPAMQSLLMARCVVELMASSGFPAGCCQLLLVPGVAVGEQLLPDSRIQAVLFTGSLATGQWLNRALARREPCPLIAETGGQNAMLVDATALLEQVVDDVVSSAFHSAGQRCSALRVLFVQEDIAEALIAMLSGAMAELVVGDPASVASDVGPLIDEQARRHCEEHCVYLQRHPRQQARLLYACPLPEDSEGGYYFPPQLYEISSMSLLMEEVFGPIVHLIRFPAGGIDGMLEQINSSGYGLTLCIQSRIDTTCREVAQRAEVGNVYVNRNMVGAVVGVQPFGGRGLSGTGPKAGGPLYLSRLVRWPASDLIDRKANRVFLGTEPAAHRATILPADGEPKPSGWLIPASLNKAQQRWAARSGQNRISCIENFLQSTELVGEPVELTGWGGVSDLLAVPQELPGPTGENNTYQFEGRGLILLVLDEGSVGVVFLKQLAAALVAGNAVLVVRDGASPLAARWQDLRANLQRAGVDARLLHSAELDELFPLVAEVPIKGVCVAPGFAQYRELAMALAARPGAICPLISALNFSCLVARLSYEKTITCNTAAAGGNASLLCLEG